MNTRVPKYRRNNTSWGNTRREPTAEGNLERQEGTAGKESNVEQAQFKRRSFRPKPNVHKVASPIEQSFPAPAHLSKADSKLRNDPLYAEAIFPEPSQEFRQETKNMSFTPGCDGFVPLTQEIYSTISARNHNFKRYVSESAFTYYLGMHLEYRLLSLSDQYQHELTEGERNLVDAMEAAQYVVPASFAMYLGGFGGVDLPSGATQDFGILEREYVTGSNGIPGYFGPISDRADLYTSYVCPGLLAQRVVESVYIAKNRIKVKEWNLPDNLAYYPPDREGEECDPDAEPFPLNTNCLGYLPLEDLSYEQISFLEGCGITEDRFPCYQKVPFCAPLMNAIQNYLYLVPRIILKSVTKNKQGSEGQLVVVKNSRDFGLISPSSAYKMVGNIGSIGASFQYNKFKTRAHEHWPNDFRDWVPPRPYMESILHRQERNDGKIYMTDLFSADFDPRLRNRSISQGVDVEK